jgi:hypothetical protein
MGGQVVMPPRRWPLVERPPLELGDLVEHWTLAGNQRDLVARKNYDTQLGFALLLKFYGRFGRSRVAAASCMTMRSSSSRGNLT